MKCTLCWIVMYKRANVGCLFACTCETEERNGNTGKTRHSEREERGRGKKEAVGGSYWRRNTSKRAIETFGLHFLQTSNETQEQSRSVCLGPDDLTRREELQKGTTRGRRRKGQQKRKKEKGGHWGGETFQGVDLRPVDEDTDRIEYVLIQSIIRA